MIQEQEPIKIEIPVEEETPFVPEHEGRGSNAKAKAAQVGKSVASTTARTVRKAWDSESRRKVTRGVAQGATTVASKGGRFVSEKVAQAAERQAREQVTAVQTRVKETDWKAEAKNGTAQSLRWLSHRLSCLAARLTGEKAPPRR